MRYVLVGWCWNLKREAYVKVPPFTSGGLNFGIEYTERLLDAKIYEDVSFASYVMQDSEKKGLRGLHIKQVDDREWFEALLKG